MSRFPLSTIWGPEIHGYELNGHKLWWTTDGAQPHMSVPCEDGSEIHMPVQNPEFFVPPTKNWPPRAAMKEAALAFFAPLLDNEEVSR